MPYTNITKPNQGDATRKALADALIDNDNFFNSMLSVLLGLGVPNGSFEADGDDDGEPDEWIVTLFTGGSFELTGAGKTDTECRHGRRAVKFTSPGGSGNGGGYMESLNFIEVTPARPVSLSWQLKSSIATIRNKVELRWFDDSQNYISTTAIYSSVANPAAWTNQRGAAIPPATARYMKIRITGAEDTTTIAGSVYFDDIRLDYPIFKHETRADWPGTGNWVCPAGVYGVYVEVVGGGGQGGGGGSGGGTPGGGGGGGGYSRGYVAVVPGTLYTLQVGAGGSGGPATLGADGEESHFASFIGGGGAGGKGYDTGGAGGAGGTASGGEENLAGTAGISRGAGSYGGYSQAMPTRANMSSAGQAPGAGGAGLASTQNPGPVGHDGLVIIRY